jgi:Arc/MetJ-type ribon-helix-helix transcriptional regulator
MKMELGDDARRIIEDQIRARRYPDAESVVLAALESLLSKAPDEFEPGEMEALLREGEESIEREGTLDVDEALEARRARRARPDAGAA